MDEAEYEARLKELSGVAVADLIAARSDAHRLRAALARFFKRGAHAKFTTGELVDFLGVSGSPILEQAGFTDEEAERAMEIVGDLSDDEIASA